MWNSMWNFIATLAKTYFSARFAARTNRSNRTKKQPAHASKTTCTSAYYPRHKSIPTDEPHTVHVYRIIFSFPSILTEQEERKLTLLRYRIESGQVTEEI